MNAQSINYQKANKVALSEASDLNHAESEIALNRFIAFLKGIDSTDFIEKEIDKVYTETAYLNDTLKSLKGLDEIREHFLKMAEVMTSYSVKVDDIAKSAEGYYIRWIMKFSAPKLAGGKEIESIGVSYVVFNSEGKALIHQDFWDSTSGMFEHLPLIGSGIKFVKKRF